MVLFRLLLIGSLRGLLEMLRDAADTVHVDTYDFTYLVLSHAGERELHDHHVLQQVLDGLLLLLLPFAMSLLPFPALADRRQLLVDVGA